MRRLLDSFIAFAGNLRGRRFAIVAGSSIIATSAIVASAMTAGAGPGSLAAAAIDALASAATQPSVSGAGSTAGSGGLTSLPPPPPPSSSNSAPAAAVAAVTTAATTPSTAAKKTPTQTTPTTPTSTVGRVKHVFVIALASPGYDNAFGPQSQMPYLAGTLRPQGELLDNYQLVDSAGLPNYVAMVSGQAPNPSTEAECTTYSEFPSSSQPDAKGNVPGSGCVYPVKALSIADQMTSGQLSWGAYMEGMGQGTTSQTCVKPGGNAADAATGEDGGYATRHNPFVYFHSLLDLGDCASHDVSLENLPAALKSAKATPNYVFVSPNFCNSGSVTPCPNGDPGGPASADRFLSQWAPQILSSAAYKQDGVLIVTFGQQLPADPANPHPNVGTLLISHFLGAGSTSTAAYNSYSLFRSTEDLFGLGHLAGANTAASFAGQLLGKNGTAAAGAGDRTKRAS